MFPKIRRQAAWLLPGLSIKRWVGIGVIGLIAMGIGAALILDLQPVTVVIRSLANIALVIPNSISGPLALIVGGLMLYLGFSKTYQTVLDALHYEGDADILEALYRQSKLVRGPRIVAIGGGTGLSTLLRGLKHHTGNITAVVTVGDDGGSSGRLRKEQGVIPPGDIRNCIAALADDEGLTTQLFQYRFKTGQGLEGHSFGNLFLTAMCQVTGGMVSAIKESSRVLNIQGRVLPSTLDNIRLVAEMEDGSIVEGESSIPEAHGKIKRVKCEPACPLPLPEVIAAIKHAQLIVMGPGSLYTSVLPNLLIDEIACAVAENPAPKAYVTNIMTQPGETDGFTVGDHVQAILDHAPRPGMVSAVFVNSSLPPSLVEKYTEHGYRPVELDTERCEQLGVQVVKKYLVNEENTQVIRHDSDLLAQAIIDWFKQESHKKDKPPAGSQQPVMMMDALESVKDDTVQDDSANEEGEPAPDLAEVKRQ